MDRADEQRTIKRALRGDREAAGSLVRAHQRSLYVYILRMSGKPELAEDVVQEAFIRALTHLERFDFRYRFSTWLFTIGRRVYLNEAARLRPVLSGEPLDGRASAGEPVGRLDERRETRDVARCALQAALLELRREQREVLVLFHQHGWPIALIGDQLGMPEGTVKSHLHRGRRRLRELLTARGGVMRALASSMPELRLAGAADEAGIETRPETGSGSAAGAGTRADAGVIA